MKEKNLGTCIVSSKRLDIVEISKGIGLDTLKSVQRYKVEQL